jgi:nitrite reductase/ring-hydroxylating ferredoxin subunit
MAEAAVPDFTSGFPVDRLPNGTMIQGKVGGEEVILARQGDDFFAFGAGCTHYHNPLVEGAFWGDSLRCPLHHACFDLRTGRALCAPAFEPLPCRRVEHWVVAERQGQVAARNILGYREPFDAVPFFWTQQFGVCRKYAGHAEKWDAAEFGGSLEAGSCAIRYKLAGKTLALATAGREAQILAFERAGGESLRKLPRASHFTTSS